MLIHSFRGSRRIGRLHFIGAAITFCGVILVSGLLDEHIPLEAWKGAAGIGLLLIAQFSAAAYMVRSEKLLKRYSHYQVTALMFFVTFLLFVATSIPVIASEGFKPVGSQAWFCVVYGGLVSLCLANILWTWGIKKVGSHRAAIFNNLPPVFALVAGILFLNEIPLPSQVLGVVMILGGLLVFNGMPFRSEQVL